MYNFVMRGIIGGSISVIGIVCNIGSLIVFHHGVIKTPTTYQLWWLAIVDTIFLVLWFVYVAVFSIINYLHIDFDSLYWQVIRPYIQVCIWPVLNIARTSTNWLTVFIGVYRYLSICKPVSNSYRHVERHRRKYVVIVLSISAVCNIPYFFGFSLSQDEETNMVYFRYDLTNFGKSNLFKLVYHNIMFPACTVCLPVIILLIVTVKMMIVLRKKQRNVQDSNMSDLNINTVLITIVLTFIISQLPLLVDSIVYIIYDRFSTGTPECSSFLFYFSHLVIVFLALNSAARPFIYMMLKNHFAWPLRYTLRNKLAESIEMGNM